MYKVNYYKKSITDNGEEKFEFVASGLTFRLRKNALRWVLEIEQSEYREKGYATEPRVGGFYGYKSEKTANGDREITEIMIKVEKA